MSQLLHFSPSLVENVKGILKGAYNSDCLVPSVKYGGGSILIWAAISWYSVGPVITVNGKETAKVYEGILGDHAHSMVQTLFPLDTALFQDDNAPTHTAGCVQDWFEGYEEVKHLLWPAQSPDLNIIEAI